MEGDLAVDLGLVWLDDDEEPPGHRAVQLPLGPRVREGGGRVLVGSGREGRPAREEQKGVTAGNRTGHTQTCSQPAPNDARSLAVPSQLRAELGLKTSKGPGAAFELKRPKQIQEPHLGVSPRSASRDPHRPLRTHVHSRLSHGSHDVGAAACPWTEGGTPHAAHPRGLLRSRHKEGRSDTCSRWRGREGVTQSEEAGHRGTNPVWFPRRRPSTVKFTVGSRWWILKAGRGREALKGGERSGQGQGGRLTGVTSRGCWLGQDSFPGWDRQWPTCRGLSALGLAAGTRDVVLHPGEPEGQLLCPQPVTEGTGPIPTQPRRGFELHPRASMEQYCPVQGPLDALMGPGRPWGAGSPCPSPHRRQR